MAEDGRSAPITTTAILKYLFIYLSNIFRVNVLTIHMNLLLGSLILKRLITTFFKKIRLDISCGFSARKTIHICHALFSWKICKKENCRLQVFSRAL